MTFRERLRGKLILIPASYLGAPCAPAFAQTGNRTKMLVMGQFEISVFL
jgi:hypothetical protein